MSSVSDQGDNREAPVNKADLTRVWSNIKDLHDDVSGLKTAVASIGVKQETTNEKQETTNELVRGLLSRMDANRESEIRSRRIHWGPVGTVIATAVVLIGAVGGMAILPLRQADVYHRTLIKDANEASRERQNEVRDEARAHSVVLQREIERQMHMLTLIERERHAAIDKRLVEVEGDMKWQFRAKNGNDMRE